MVLKSLPNVVLIETDRASADPDLLLKSNLNVGSDKLTRRVRRKLILHRNGHSSGMTGQRWTHLFKGT